ncbi:glutamate racemase [Patescibacteria group bacterium AH-259-L07]|nr:glutamate racemase [Patescibacteria group bacterium AH-259-L07]
MIGIFDSGIGGLTVVKKIFEYLNRYQVLYIGDTARAPYGDRGKEVIKRYAFQATDFLLHKGAKIIVVACNTISAVAVDDLKKKYNVPIFEVVNPGVRAAVKATKNKRVGVIGTRATINSKIYEKLLHKADKKIQVFTRPAPLLVPLVEENWIKKPETKMIAKRYLHPLRLKQIDTLILACTHYPFLKKLISLKVGKNVTIIDPGEEVAKVVKKYIDQHRDIEKMLKKGSRHQFFVSDKTEKFQTAANHWLGTKIKLKKVDMYMNIEQA